MINIGFLFPSSHYLHDPFKGDPHTHFQILTTIDDRLNGNVNTSLIDLRGIKREYALHHIPEQDIYLHSVYTLDHNEQVSTVQSLRERYPKAKHIAGGPHIHSFQEESLNEFDSLILGDGEESVLQAINDFQKSGLKTIYTQDSPIDVNQYPFPRRHYLPKTTIARKGMMTLKNKPGYDELFGTTVIFSRGCPYNCAFCVMPKIREFNPGIRHREPSKIKQEIEYLQNDFGIQGINLLDEIGIPLNKNKAISMLEAIASTGITWRGQCRVDGITPEIAKLARESGCVALGLGVESVSQTALDLIDKRIEIEKAKETISLLKLNGIESRVYMILGLPGEPENIVDQSWSFIKQTSPDLVFLSMLTIRPGTELFLHPEKYGIKTIDTDWEKSMHMFGRFEHETPTLTFEYEEDAPWGKAPNPETIVRNYEELQTRLREHGLSSL